MRPQLRTLIGVLGLVAMLVACTSSDDDDRNQGHAITDPGTADALSDYWDAGGRADEALAATNDLWETFAALAGDPATPAADILAAAQSYAQACSLAAAELDEWSALERRINSFAGAKSAIDEATRDAALAALECAADAALVGGESLIVCWQVLGGEAGLRTALADPDMQLPVDGPLADDLATRIVVRDAMVVEAIQTSNDHGGLLPLDQIPGTTSGIRVANYNEMSDDHPVKLACRAAVPRWDPDERAVSLALMERGARGQLRWFADVGAGGSSVSDLAPHLLAHGEVAGGVHEITLTARDAQTHETVDGEVMVLVRRLEQPSQEPRLALLSGAAAQTILDVPAGTYDVLVMADGWARGMAHELTSADGLPVTVDLTHLAEGALLFDGIDAPAMGGAGARVTMSASVASALGDPLTFDWSVEGPAVSSAAPANAYFAFVPDSAGTYTVHLTVSDQSGNAVADSVSLEVLPFAVTVSRADFTTEQIADLHFNPGETDTLQFWITNRGATDVVGVPRMQGRDGVICDAEDVPWTLTAGRQTRWNVPVTIPADYDKDRAYLDFSFTVGDETLVQELDYRVDFYVHLDFIRSPQTSRVLTVTGLVSNPQLEAAKLVLDRDRETIYNLPLDNGVFEQVIILPGSAEARRISLEVSAESGLRREEARAGFMAAIIPADFRATLLWNTNGTDVDLWVTDPDGEKCYFAHQTTASGLELDVDDVTGYGPENITGEADLPPGDYVVQVHYYSDHGTGLASDCTVLLTLHESTPDESITPFHQTISDGDIWDVCIVTWDGARVTRVEPSRRPPVALQQTTLPAK